MSRNLSTSEPHSSVPRKGSYMYAGGRGGAGSYRRYNSEDHSRASDTTGPASCLPLAKAFKCTMTAGGSHAGHAFTPHEPEESIFQFDEEMVKERETHAPVYHIGRGGAGNWIDESKPRMNRKGSTDSAGSESTESSTTSARRGLEDAFSKLSRTLSKNPRQ